MRKFLFSKYGLVDRNSTIIRSGKGTSTSYIIERGEEEEITSEEITAMLPDVLKDKYDGTMESLYKIIEEQITMPAFDSVRKPSTEDDEDEEAEEETKKIKKSRTISVSDEDEEELAPKKTSPSKSSGLKSKSIFKKK